MADDRRDVFNAGGAACSCLVEATNEMGKLALFAHGGGNGWGSGVGVVDDARANAHGVRSSDALASFAGLVVDPVTGRFYAGLPACRSSLAGVGGLWRAHVVPRSRLRFYAEPQLSGDHR